MENMIPPQNIKYRGKGYKLQKNGRYYASHNPKAEYRLLHRQIWADAHGRIPEGKHIHHIDGNPLNNNISNLELADPVEHRRQHMVARLKDPEYAKKHKKAFDEARQRNIIWQQTAEGKEERRKSTLNAWVARKKDKECECSVCRKTFFSWDKNTKYCSKSCRARSFREDPANQVTLACPVCGSSFTQYRHARAKTCSCKCGSILNHRNRKDKQSG